MLNFLKKYHIPILLTGFILIALTFRLALLFNRGSFWFDEMFSVYFSEFGFKEIWQYMLYENNPPLYVFLLKLWGFVFGNHEYWARGLSIILNLFSIVSIYFLGNKMFSKVVGLFAAFLVSISSFQIFLSVEARSFALIFFLGIISTYFFWDIFKGSKRLSWVGYIFISFLLVFTHLFSWFLIIAQNIIFFIYKRKSLKRWIFSQLFILGIFLIWFIPAFFTKDAEALSSSWFLGLNYPSDIILSHWSNFLIIGNEILVVGALMKILIVIIFLSLIIKKVKLTPQILFCIILMCLPAFLGFMYTKYFIISSIGFYLLLAKGLERIDYLKPPKSPLSGGLYILVIIFLLTLSSTLNILFNLNHKWDKIGEYMERNESRVEKVIVSRFNNVLLVNNYYNGNLPIEAFLPILEKHKDDNLNIIKYNWQYYLEHDNVNELAKSTEGYEKIFLVYKPLEKDRLVEKWFLENNWKILEKKVFDDGEVSPEVIIFERI